MSCGRVISKNSFNINQTFILNFKYNIKSDSDYGFSVFFGNSDLLHSKDIDDIKNKNNAESIGLYGKTKKSQLPIFFSICLDNKGKFAAQHGKFIDGKTELNNYNTITLRCIDDDTNFKYISDAQIDDFYTPEGKFNNIRIILDNRGSRLIVQLKKYNDKDYVVLGKYMLPSSIIALNNEFSNYTYGISSYTDNGNLSIKDLTFSVCG